MITEIGFSSPISLGKKALMMGPTSAPIRVLSASGALERRQAFMTYAPPPNATWSFFDAHMELHAPLQYDEAKAIVRYKRKLSSAELGCYSSHYNLWVWLLNSPFSQAIILEDDVIVDWDFLNTLVTTDMARMGINYLRLFGKAPPRWLYVKPGFLGPYHHLIRVTNFTLGTQAYLVTKEGARQLIAKGQVVDSPIDTYMDRYWEHGVPNLALYPFPVFERTQVSSIGNERLVQAEKLSLKDTVRSKLMHYQDRVAIMRNTLGGDPQNFHEQLKEKIPGAR